MRKMTKGEMTKERILASAKELFYEQGYDATTIQQIADRSGTTLGSMTYHFATKSTFVDQLFDDYFANINTAIQKYQYEPWNSFEAHFKLTMVYYNNLLSDPNTQRFYYEIHKNSTLFSFLHRRITSVYLDFIADYHLRIRPIEFEAILTADLGARRECLISYCEKRLKMPIEDFAIFLLTNTARCLGIPESAIYKTSYQSLVFYRSQDFSGIQLLK